MTRLDLSRTKNDLEPLRSDYSKTNPLLLTAGSTSNVLKRDVVDWTIVLKASTVLSPKISLSAGRVDGAPDDSDDLFGDSL